MSDDFLAKLQAGKQQYDTEQSGTVKRRKFVVGLDIRGRLLPYEDKGQMRFLETFYNHYYESVRGDGWVFLACPKNGNNWDAPCPFCDPMINHYKEHGSDSIYNSYKRKRKYKVNFYVTDVRVLEKFTVSDTDLGLWKEVIGQVIVIDLPFAVKEKIDNALNKEDLGLSIFNPMNGYDLEIKISTKKTDDGDMPQYGLTEFARKATAVPGELKTILGNCANIANQIEILKNADATRLDECAIAEGLKAAFNTGAAPVGQTSSANQGEKPPISSPLDPPEPIHEPTPTVAAEKATDGGSESLADLFSRYRTGS